MDLVLQDDMGGGNSTAGDILRKASVLLCLKDWAQLTSTVDQSSAAKIISIPTQRSWSRYWCTCPSPLGTHFSGSPSGPRSRAERAWPLLHAYAKGGHPGHGHICVAVLIVAEGMSVSLTGEMGVAVAIGGCWKVIWRMGMRIVRNCARGCGGCGGNCGMFLDGPACRGFGALWHCGDKSLLRQR